MGFRPGDGVGTNVSLLQAIIKERTDPAKLRPLSVCYVDVKETFNSVGQFKSLVSCLVWVSLFLL